ncbi:MAG TPA: PAS domain-containing protein, partial [Burkholderiaceae bacterium]|nr:PAS domain-containing protein [Burkholderiaceae bacterium]
MRIRTQLLLAAAGAAVVTLTVLGSLWYVTHRSAANLQAQTDGQDIARDVANLLTLTQEYTVYGGERATLQWRARHAQLRQTVAQALARESNPHPALAEVGQRVADLLPLYDRLVEAYREASTDLALRRRELMVERLVSETQELVDARHRWATALIERQAREQRVANAIVLMASALLSLLIVGLAFLVYRRGLVPLARLQAAATAIERGDLSVRCDAGTHDELGDTGRTVNAMAESLLAANAALRAAKERYELAVEGADQGLWDWDLTNNLQFVSPRAQELLGLVPGETLRPRTEWMGRVIYHPDDAAAVRAATSAHLRGESKHFQVEYRMRHQSGDWHWYRQRGIALRDEHRRPYRMAGSVEDVTAQKSAEDERLRLERQLAQAKKLEAIGSLAGGIAHDFNNILAAILGNGEMAQAEAPKGTPLRRHVDAVVTAGARAKSLVERILAFSRSGMGDRSAVHVQSVVDEALHLVATSLPRHLQLDRRLAAGDACVLGDATQIHQVVMNLCTNAVQAMKSNGTLCVSLDVMERSDAVTTTSTVSGGRYVRLRVRDTGTGIPAAALDRIFDPFFTTKDVGVGTGLGLSLVLRI